mmetsp:Transcript_19744/g.49113  ORF Transcript_19744/g.49113 Transcript_19744/m.49113 type:complete len:208 (-) Transcript_19744:699-1322(-)
MKFRECQVTLESLERNPALNELKQSHGQKGKGESHQVEKSDCRKGSCCRQWLGLDVHIRHKDKDWLDDGCAQQDDAKANRHHVRHLGKGIHFLGTNSLNLLSKGAFPCIKFDDSDSRENFVHHLDTGIGVLENLAAHPSDNGKDPHVDGHQKHHVGNTYPGGISNLLENQYQRNNNLDGRGQGESCKLQETLKLHGVVGHHVDDLSC